MPLGVGGEEEILLLLLLLLKLAQKHFLSTSRGLLVGESGESLHTHPYDAAARRSCIMSRLWIRNGRYARCGINFNPVGCNARRLLGANPRGVPSNLMPVVVQTILGDRLTLYVFRTS